MEFSEELRLFRARTLDPGFAGLIVLGTERHNITAGLLLGALHLRRVAFLTTPETRDFPQYIAELLSTSADSWDCPTADHGDTTQVYQSVKALREAWGDITDPARIAVDVTGGRKPMSVGLEKAAHILGLTTIYVESDYWPLESGKRGPQPGTQRLVIPPNPYLVFGDLEAAEAVRQYAQHDYAVAATIFGELAARVVTPAPAPDLALAALGVRYTAMTELAAMYAAWDVLDFTRALAYANTLLGLPLSNLPELAPHVAHLATQRAMLEHLVSVATSVVRRDDQARQTLADAAAMLPLLGTLHAAALRRAAQGRYDFAALFRYRCLELISQHRLATYGLLANAPHFEVLGARKADANTLFQQQQRDAGRSSARGFGKLRVIGMFDGYMLLAALDDPLVRAYDIKRIEERSKARNQSVLAHGYRLIGPAEYAEFAEVVDEIVDRLFARVLSRSRADWEQALRFVELPAT